jgi:hypothetical protein
LTELLWTVAKKHLTCIKCRKPIPKGECCIEFEGVFLKYYYHKTCYPREIREYRLHDWLNVTVEKP